MSFQMRALALVLPPVMQLVERIPMTPERVREIGGKAERRLKVAEGVTYTATTIAGLPAFRATSGNPDRGVVLHLHGGAYVAGSAEAGRMMSEVCANGGPDLISLEYRMAPEHPYPAAVDDALAAYAELVATVGADRVVVTGESAGGGLTLALLQRARDEGLPMPAAAVPVFPWADLTQTSASMGGYRFKDMLTTYGLTKAAGQYAGGVDPRTPGLSPVFGSFAGMPPMLIPVGTRDRLLDDARAVAASLRKEGVDVTLTEYPGCIHGFVAFRVPEAKACRAEITAYVLKHLPA